MLKMILQIMNMHRYVILLQKVTRKTSRPIVALKQHTIPIHTITKSIKSCIESMPKIGCWIILATGEAFANRL